VSKPFAVIFDKAGNMYIGQFGTKTEGQLVRKVDTSGIITTIAGTGKVGARGDGGPATNGEFNFIHDIVIGPDGNLYVADSFNRKVRKIDVKSGILTTFAGTGEGKGATGDAGPADQAALDGVASLWFSNDGATLYVSGFSKFVRTIDMKTGIISTLKNCPGGRSIAIDSKGNLYIAGGTALRVRTPDGNVKVLLDETHLGGSNIPLAGNPKHLGIDERDNVLICDELHHLLRKYIPAEEKLVTIMGDGKPGTGGLGGPPEKAQLKNPHGVQFHNGAIYVADSMNDRVLKISAD
jgi:streptogramin lyase